MWPGEVNAPPSLPSFPSLPPRRHPRAGGGPSASWVQDRHGRWLWSPASAGLTNWGVRKAPLRLCAKVTGIWGAETGMCSGGGRSLGARGARHPFLGSGTRPEHRWVVAGRSDCAAITSIIPVTPASSTPPLCRPRPAVTPAQAGVHQHLGCKTGTGGGYGVPPPRD